MILNDINLPVNFLYLLQKEEYKILRFIKKLIKNPIPYKVQKLTKIDWTYKAKEISLYSLLIFIFLLAIIQISFQNIFLNIIFIIFSYIFWWIYLILSLLLIIPREKFNRYLLIKMSSKLINNLKKNKLNIIGVTGSYGKTSTKFYLDNILKSQFNTYATPKSYNTLFGIAKPKFVFGFVTKVLEYLNNSLDYFIVEMGAYKTGEISELCQAFPPDISILTGITTMHLERFGTLENIIKAKSEIISSLSKNSIGMINGDNIYTYNVSQKFKKNGYTKLYTYGYKKYNDFILKIINIDTKGTEFTVSHKNKTYKFNTKIIGTGNILNLSCTISLSIILKINDENITRAVYNMSEVEARMQIIDIGNGITIINNGYSSNPESFKQTVETLKLFKSVYKIIVTPGIFELGKEEYSIHKELGKYIDNELDLLLLLAKSEDEIKIKALKEGAINNGFNEKNIVFINDIKKYINVINERNVLPCVVVFENDLPDLYNY